MVRTSMLLTALFVDKLCNEVNDRVVCLYPIYCHFRSRVIRSVCLDSDRKREPGIGRERANQFV
jgi:hypothetical protein